MSDGAAVAIALITGLPATIAAVNSFINAGRLAKMQVTQAELQGSVNKATAISVEAKKAVNGRMDELLDKHGKLEYARGVEETKRENIYG